MEKRRPSNSKSKTESKHVNHAKSMVAKIASKEELSEMSTTDQILLVEEMAEKIVSNPQENVVFG
jgi:hypothetical protein